MEEPGGSPTEANRATVRRAFHAWREGTAAITDMFAPDTDWERFTGPGGVRTGSGPSA